MKVPFTKMQGLGNDFMVLDLVTRPIRLNREQIRRLADRHFGIGFDQLLQIEPPSSADVDFDYRIFNADGNEVEHCGNGARCFARFVHDRGLTDRNPIRVKTVKRVLELALQPDGQVTVDMGRPMFNPADIPLRASENALVYRRTVELDGQALEVEFSALSMGNPHAVLIVEDVARAPVEKLGMALGAHPDFPEGVNVGFMEIENRSRVKLRVFERGVGETLACGTGACAAVAAGRSRDLLDESVVLSLTGGELRVSWNRETDPVMMTGPASTVFEGSIEL
ncbi:MAG: diaminopimelate epimerase [Gammaproteobacteria bacterium]|nr:diaminopimelate epimerase [Pseudomonadales bacterium]MCP5347521.1 diaminopimelate epimerase [Pseudomonadales bacterium]